MRIWKERTKCPPSHEQTAFRQVVKACNIAMQSILLLQQENNELRTRHSQYERRRDTGRTHIQKGGVLIAEQAETYTEGNGQLPSALLVAYKSIHVYLVILNKIF